jgi:hypothetical protein
LVALFTLAALSSLAHAALVLTGILLVTILVVAATISWNTTGIMILSIWHNIKI